ncbi:hypothetical protein [Helicobacter turcicus]|uniref:Uncharacterized protein n=1 Tax=Helicobacter turcicus TaxID=2867412 RepID=A0ABS7JPA8_9HELI|nr:hypothetical protein [Helicobacter turcicus]MBX7491244.1 hypothetical protein [Helicobacter turcicus]MBX7546117.1 hypothetical protein [Helicobacter turcicus]
METIIQELTQELSSLSSLQLFCWCFILLELFLALIYFLFFEESVSKWCIKIREQKEQEKRKELEKTKSED